MELLTFYCLMGLPGPSPCLSTSPPHFPMSSRGFPPGLSMAIPSSSFKPANPKGFKVWSRTRGFVCRDLGSLEIIVNTNTHKRVCYYMMITFPFLTDLAALLIIEWHLEGLGEGGCSCSTPGPCLGWGWCHHSSGFWCLRAGDWSLFISCLWVLRP